MAGLPSPPEALLLDIDGVLHVGDEPLPGAIEALARLRELAGGLRLVTNTTSKPRRAIVGRLRAMGFDVDEADVLTPAALAVAHCRARGHDRVHLMVGAGLREDLAGIDAADPDDDRADAVVLGDLGDGFTAGALNAAFRQLVDGAELVALQHNRYWRSGDGLVLDVGAYAAALEYAAGVDSTVVGKPSPRFFEAALGDLGATAAEAVMVGDDVEGDVGGGLGAGIPSVLVRTGKYRPGAAAAAGVEPTTTVDSIADLPELLGG